MCARVCMCEYEYEEHVDAASVQGDTASRRNTLGAKIEIYSRCLAWHYHHHYIADWDKCGVIWGLSGV